MRAVIELAISIGLIFGGGRMVLIKVHDTMRDMAMKKISRGLTPTKKLNDMLWK